MKTITFYSYKGGVGRSLALSNIAKRLSEFGKKVCIIDFDLDAPGIDLKFKNNISKPIKMGIVDYIYTFSKENIIPDKISNYVTKIDFHNNNYKNIDLIAAGATTTQEYWKKLAMISWGELFYNEDSQGINFFIDLKDKIMKELKPDFLLIDSRTGITDIAGITMSILADEIILFSANNAENINGIKQVINTISDPLNNYKNEVIKYHVVLSRIPFFGKANDKFKEQKAINYFSNEININLSKLSRPNVNKIFVLHSDPDLEYEEKLKIGYDDETLKNNSAILSLDYLKLFKELTQDVLSTEDRERFDKLRKTEILIEQARETRDSVLKIKILKEAIELNPSSEEAFFELAQIYILTKNFELAVEEIQKAIKINPNKLLYKSVLALSLGRLKDNDSLGQSQKLFGEILEINPSNPLVLKELGRLLAIKKNFKDALKYFELAVEIMPDDNNYNSLANIYKEMGDYEKALDLIYKALEINPQNALSTGTLAEIQGYLGNDREFYKNLELFFSFGNQSNFQEIIEEDKIYEKYFKETRFIEMLNKYNVLVDIKN